MSKKRTIAELQVGEQGWVFDSGIFPDVKHIELVGPYTDVDYLMPQFLVRELLSSGNVRTTKDLVVFGNTIVHETEDEAYEEMKAATNRLYKERKKRETPTVVSPDPVNWEQIRAQAAIEVLGSLIDKTEIVVDVGGECVLKDVYARTAVEYADALVSELKRSKV